MRTACLEPKYGAKPTFSVTVTSPIARRSLHFQCRMLRQQRSPKIFRARVVELCNLASASSLCPSVPFGSCTFAAPTYADVSDELSDATVSGWFSNAYINGL